jgi:hypothetical protein
MISPVYHRLFIQNMNVLCLVDPVEQEAESAAAHAELVLFSAM